VLGLTSAAPATVSLTVNAAGSITASLFTATSVPGILTDSDASAVELGVKFQSSVAGRITAIRFYKGPQNTGTHTAHLWSATGTSLATATFAGETASGWQQVNLTTPVAITANTIYVASSRYQRSLLGGRELLCPSPHFGGVDRTCYLKRCLFLRYDQQTPDQYF
jgi:Domain of unknown function (DUF4082)